MQRDYGQERRYLYISYSDPTRRLPKLFLTRVGPSARLGLAPCIMRLSLSFVVLACLENGNINTNFRTQSSFSLLSQGTYTLRILLQLRFKPLPQNFPQSHPFELPRCLLLGQNMVSVWKLHSITISDFD